MTDRENVLKIEREDRTFFLVGTAHVSKESVELVSRVIEEEKPDTVCVELCSSRYETLTQENRWKETDLLKVIREKRAFLLLMNLILSSFQRRIGQKLGVKPGEEMLRAVRAAEATGARVWLSDRDIRTTLARTWRLMGLWTRMKLMASLITSAGEVDKIEAADIEKMKQKDVLVNLLSDVGEMLPDVQRTLIDERDQYLTEKIRTAPGNRIVAVVGAGHVPGIQKYWYQPVDMQALETLPPKGKVGTILKWGIPCLVAVLIVLGFVWAGTETGAAMVKWWVAANALLAGLGATLALAHPLTILTAVVASPITSLNPMIAAGWVAGFVEVFLRKPKVRDFESLTDDILSLRGFWKNRITRILLIVVLTNLGSSLGAFVAIPLMARLFQ